MASETEVQYELDERPSEVVGEVIRKVKRGERAVIDRANPTIAKRSFLRARQDSVRTISAIKAEYNLNSEEIERFVGEDMNSINDKLMTLATKMSKSDLENKRRGEFRVSEQTLLEIKSVQNTLENFESLLKGIEDGQIKVNRDG